MALATIWREEPKGTPRKDSVVIAVEENSGKEVVQDMGDVRQCHVDHQQMQKFREKNGHGQVNVQA